MKKFAIVLFAALILLLVTAALVLPSQAIVERSTVVKGSPEAIFAQISDLRRWEKWSPWLAKDPEMVLTYSQDPATGKGASYSWKSESQGEGSMTIAHLLAPRMFEGDLDFGSQGKAKAFFFVEPLADGETKVTWRMIADLGNNPIGKMFGLGMDSMVGPDFEDGLQRLKVLVEENPQEVEPESPASSPTPAPEETSTEETGS